MQEGTATLLRLKISANVHRTAVFLQPVKEVYTLYK